jgi:hypothetical protein
MYWSRSVFLEINGWAGEKGVVPCAHPSHPRTVIPHGSRFHILCCAKTGAKGPAVLTVTKGHVPVRKLRQPDRPVTLGMKYEKLNDDDLHCRSPSLSVMSYHSPNLVRK